MGRPLVAVKILVQVVAWSSAAAFIYVVSWHELGVAVGFLGGTCVVAMAALERWAERQRWMYPIEEMATKVRAISENPERPIETLDNPQLAELVRAVSEMRSKLISMREPGVHRNQSDSNLAASGEFDIVPPEGFDFTPNGRDSTEARWSAGSDMVSRLDLDTLNWLDASDADQTFLGWPLRDLKQMSFLDIVDAKERDLALAQIHAAIDKGEDHNLLYRIRNRRGEVKTVELHLSVRYRKVPELERPIPAHLKMSMIDMTSRPPAELESRKRTRELVEINQQLRRMNRELESLKNRYSSLYHEAPSLYLSVDATGKVIECNNTLLGTLGRQRVDVIGRPYVELETSDRRGAFREWFELLKLVSNVEIETRWVAKEGDPLAIAIAARAVRAPDGRFQYAMLVGRDVTRKRELEAQVRENSERLAQANNELQRKNKELDQFAYIVAHDLKEPLRTLTAFSGFLERDCGDAITEVGRESLQHIMDASRRMRAFIDDLQTLGRAGNVTGEFVRVNLSVLVDRTRADFAEQLRSRGGGIVIQGRLPDVLGDPTRIGQLISNLVGNGLKYNQSERPLVEIEAVAAPGRTIPEGHIAFEVRDNGIGIDPQFHAKVFQLFRRLHAREEYEGTGAGLAICQKIVVAHGGEIWVESQAGKGARFFFTLPAAGE